MRNETRPSRTLSVGVHDAPTAELMAAFYRGLLAGKTKADALRDAALSLRGKPGTSHPAYWAPFLVLGDWSAAR